MTETQRKIIEAAEIEFARSGFEGASVRNITSSAGVNIAAINYHFGKKEDLFREMIRFRIEPINKYRLAVLDKEYLQKKGKAIPLDRVVEIMIRPLFEQLTKHGGSDFPFMKAVGKAMGEDYNFMETLHKDILKETITRFSKAIAHSLGTQNKKTIGYCIHMVSCCISGVMIQHERLETTSQGTVSSTDIDGLIKNLTAFITGGIQAIHVTNK